MNQAERQVVGFLPKSRKKVKPPKGQNRLLAIAIDDYIHCPKLHNCKKDVEDFVEVLTSRFGFEQKNVLILVNREATAGKILKAFRDFIKEIKPSDSLIIYFSGHGTYDEVYQQGYWIPVEARVGKIEDYIPNSVIINILNRINSLHTFLIADSCFSGTLFQKYKVSVGLERLGYFPSRWGLTSGRNEVVSDGTPGDNSPFSDCLLYYLKNVHSSFGVAKLCDYVVENVAASNYQIPRGETLKVEGHRGGQFFFELKEQAAFSPSKLVGEKATKRAEGSIGSVLEGSSKLVEKANMGPSKTERLKWLLAGTIALIFLFLMLRFAINNIKSTDLSSKVNGKVWLKNGQSAANLVLDIDNGLASAITNNQGHFYLEIPKSNSDFVQVLITKNSDTLIDERMIVANLVEIPID